MRNFVIKIVNIVLIAAVLIGYNTVVEVRAQQDEIARLTAELKSSQKTADNLQSALDALAAEAEIETADAQAADKKAAEAETGLTDGTYTGQAQGFGGIIEVELTVESGTITDLEVTSAEGEDNAYFAMASEIIDTILEEQSADVDTVSGATFSSTGIRDAAADAIAQAEN